jgi:hypothetical protein
MSLVKDGKMLYRDVTKLAAKGVERKPDWEGVEHA